MGWTAYLHSQERRTFEPSSRVEIGCPRSRGRATKPVAISLLMMLAACSQDAIPTSVTGPEQNQLVSTVQVRPTEAVLPPDEVLQLSALVKGARGQTVNGRPVSWSSSDETVAYVDASGSIVAGNEGTAVITANVLGVRGHATIDVRGEVIDIVVDDPVTSIAEGDVATLTAMYVYSNGARRPAGYLRWTTSDPSVLWVDGEGEATARDAGEVTVVAAGRGERGALELRVAAGHIASVTVHASTTQLAVNEQADVWTVILNNKGKRVSKQVAWSSSAPSIVRVTAEGKIVGVAPGTATITATVSDKSGSIDITVVGATSGGGESTTPYPGRVTDLSARSGGETSISLRFTEVDDGTGSPAGYLVRYAQGTEGFDWNSGLDVTKGTCAAPLNGSGVGATIACSVDGLRSATDYIFQLVAFRTEGGSDVYGALSNLATGRTDNPGVLVDVVPSSFQVDVGAQKQLTASVTDTYGNAVNQTVSWSSSSSTVATVSASGLVSGVGTGNTTVRASTSTASDTSDGTVVQTSSGGGSGGTQLPPPPSNWSVPSDAIKVTERGFNYNGEDNWGTNSGGANRYLSDPTAPLDPSTVLEMPFGPCSNCGSSGLGNKVVKNWVNSGLPSGRELWIEHTFKYSANWATNPVANKILYPAVRNKANHPTFYGTRPTNSTDPAAPMRLALSLGGQDNTVCGHSNKSIWFNGAMPGAEIKRGQWHTVRLYLRTNDPGVCNAVARIWVDGNLVVDGSNFVFVDPGVSNQWWALNFDPVYGGGPAPIPTEQSLRTAYMTAHVR